jgi:copper transport protein
MISNRRPRSAVAAVAIFVVAGICGVVAFRVIRAVSETLAEQKPAHSASANAGIFTTTVASAIYSLQVDVSPGLTGTNEIHLYSYAPDQHPLPVVEWKGTAELPEKAIKPVEVQILPISESHAIGQVDLSAPGSWQLRFTLRISDADQATVSFSVPVRN